MHLIRLFMMAVDILEKGEIRTYRREEQLLLQDVLFLLALRVGISCQRVLQAPQLCVRDEFYEMINEYEKKLDSAARNTALPVGSVQSKSIVCCVLSVWIYEL